MRLKDLAAHLATLLEEPASTFTELHRAMREQIAGALELLIDLPPDLHDLDNGMLCRIGERLAGRQGPGGGARLDATVVAMLLIALALDCPRAEVTVKVLEVLAASAKSSVCPLTGKQYFGEALVALLSDDALNRAVSKIAISYDLGGEVEITYSTDDEGPLFSKFKIENSLRSLKPVYRVGVISLIALKKLHEFLKGVEKLEEAS